MIIQWYGQSCFKIQSGELVIAIDPFDKTVGLTPPRFKADIVLISHAHPDHANIASLTGEPFLITGPGEYEIKGVYVEGIPSFHDAVGGATYGTNTIYKIRAEDVSLLHLGGFGEKEPRPEILESIGEVDIVMVPVGGYDTIGGEAAAHLVKQLEPRFAIPMHYKISGVSMKLESAEKFLKEMGASKTAAVDRFTIKKKDIGEKDKIEVVVLERA